MSAVAFDTCAAAKRLREAGFDEHQAEAAVTMVRDAIDRLGARNEGGYGNGSANDHPPWRRRR